MDGDCGNFGARLRQLREARGLPQWALAADAEMAQRHISDYEQGKADPRLSTVLRLAAALEVPPARLVEDGEA